MGCRASFVSTPLEEVGEPAQVAVDQARLVHHVGLAGADRAGGLAGGGVPVVLEPDLGDDLSRLAKLREVPRLVLLALAPDQASLRIVDLRPRELTALDAELQGGGVRAREPLRKVGRREGEAHHLVVCAARGSTYAASVSTFADAPGGAAA